MTKKSPETCVICGQPLAPDHDLLCVDHLKAAERQSMRLAKEYRELMGESKNTDA